MCLLCIVVKEIELQDPEMEEVKLNSPTALC